MNRSIKERGKQLLQKSVLPTIYKLNKGKKTDKRLIVFADAHHDHLPAPMQPLFEMLRLKGYNVKLYCYDTARMNSAEQLRHATGFMKLYASCGAVVICDNFLPAAACEKKQDTKVVQLWHACGALKRFGYDAEDDIPAWYTEHVYKNYDLVTVSGPGCVLPFTGAMRLTSGVVQPVGVSATDKLFDQNFLAAARDKFRYFHPDARGKKVVVWAPSFRGPAGEMRDNPITPEMGAEAVHRLSQRGDYYVIESLHPHALSRTPDLSTEELLVSADALITDYSSVCFSAMLLKRPVVYYAPDLAAYEQSRGFYTDYRSLPGVHANPGALDAAVEEAVRAGETVYDTEAAGRFAESYLAGCDGHATDRIAKIMEDWLS